jgi:hypothetical protein
MIISFGNYQDNKPDSKISNDSNRELLVSVGNEKTSSDSDGDLLQDWEEVLWKTDPNNPDTDGDGTKDGVEISLQRDPNIAGPDDQIISDISPSRGSLSNSTIAENSFTTKIGVDIFKEVLSNSQDKNSSLDVNSIIQNLQNEANDNLGSNDLYSKSDLLIQINNSDESLKKYFDNLAGILIEENLKIGEIENPTDENVGLTMINIYTNVHKRLSFIPVPEIMSDIHLEYINSLYKGVYYYEIILDEEKDPLLSYYAIPKFRDSMDRADQLFTQITNYLENNDIISAEVSNSDN